MRNLVNYDRSSPSFLILTGMGTLFRFARYGWLCLLLGAWAGGQETRSKAVLATEKPVAPTTAAPKPNDLDKSQQMATLSVEPDGPVITIDGLCNSPSSDKSAVSNCKTVITRAQFEKVIDAGPSMPARARREFAIRYANALVMAGKAEQMGLDKGANFEEQMRLARIEILSRELNKAIQREASQVPDKDIEDYYRNNTASFEQAEMERIYVPKTQELPVRSDKTLSDAEKQKRLLQTGQVMKELADKLHARAIAGEDFNKLQIDAYQAAGINTTAGSSMGTIRRVSLPPSQGWVMGLKPGEVSSIIADSNGYFIYKVKAKETLSLDHVREEIIGILRSRRIQNETEDIQKSATPVFNEEYFRLQRTPRKSD